MVSKSILPQVTCNNADKTVTILARRLTDKSRAPFFSFASNDVNDHARLATEDTMEYI